MSFFDELIEKFGNDSDNFVFDATNIDGIYKYLKTIDWSERWLMALIAFHLTIFIVIILTRRFTRFQTILFLAILSLCWASESINEYSAKHWKSFSKEQYFDSNGLFISIRYIKVVFSCPLVLNSCLIVVIWLYESYLLLIEVVKLKKRSLKKTESNKATSVKEGETKKDL